MKNIKKNIAFLLALTTMLNSLTINAFAVSNEKNEENFIQNNIIAAEKITDDDVCISLKNQENETELKTEIKENNTYINNENTLFYLNDIDVNNLNIEFFEEILKVSTYEIIGEWLVNLSDKDYEKMLSLDTSLKDPTYIIADDGSVSNEADMLFYEVAEISYWNSLTSTFSWNDRYQGGSRGDAKFRIDFYCDGERVGRYTVTASNVSQPSDGSTSTLSLSTISGSDWACSHGHDLNVKFTKIEAVTSSSTTWSGIRLFGQYTRPGHYIVTDGATNSGSSNYDGFWPSYFTRFGTNTYGTTGYSNKWCLDARYNSAPIVDEFALEGNMYVIGLYENSSINNYGYSTYFIDLQPVGMTYYVDPNGGYYNNTKNITTYKNNIINKESEIIETPTWNDELSGKTFIGWSVKNNIITKDQNNNTIYLTDKINTNEKLTVLYGAKEDGYYVSKSLSNREYGSYIEWPNHEPAYLTANWKTDWIKVFFDENAPSGESGNIQGLNPENKIVYYQQAYGELPQPTLYGYDFMGWYTSPTGGQLVDENTICEVNQSHTLYAHWQDSLHTLTFDMNLPKTHDSSTVNGMTSYKVGDKYQKEIWYNKAYGYIYNSGNNNWPEPTVANLTFSGWFTDPIFGVEISASTIYDGISDTIIYAHWDDQLLLDGETNLSYNPYVIGSTTFNKGGVDLEWTEGGTTDTYYVYRKTASGSYDAIQEKITTKKYADAGAIDAASPNSISENSVNKIIKQDVTQVTFKEPLDNGTSYTYYIDEIKWLTSNDISGTIAYKNSAQSYKAPIKGTYKFTLYGGASASGQKGAVASGQVTLNAGQTVYVVTGGKGSGRTGGYNGGANGGTGGVTSAQGSGGGGATTLSTANRGTIGSYANYKGELLAVAAGAGGTGGKSSGASSNGSQGAGGNAGAAGTTIEYKHSTYGFNIIAGGGGAGTTSAAGSGGTQRSWISQSTPMSGQVYTGGGGGGGGGYYGGGGGTAGSLMYSNLEVEGLGGSAGSFGTGGAGANGVQYGAAYFGLGGGGGGGGGTYNKLSDASNKTGSSATNTTNGYVAYQLVTDLQGTSVQQSNITTEMVKTGIKGYRYIIDSLSTTNITASSGNFTESKEINVEHKSNEQYLHIAAQDGAGNISTTIHVLIPGQYSISYNLDGGIMAEGTENPVSYNPSTPTFTLNAPEKEGHKFIGWTGSNGNNPELEVSVIQGTTGNLEYTANWMSTMINVDKIDISGSNIFTNKEQKWYVKSGTEFLATFGSYTNDKLEYFSTNINDLHIKNSANQHIQSIRSILMMEEYSGTNGTVTVNNTDLDVYIATENTRHSVSQEFTTDTKMKLNRDKEKIVLYPQSHIITAEDIRLPDLLKNNTYSSLKWDENKKATVISDGKHPEISIDIPSIFKEEANWKITIDEDIDGSGIKDTKIYIKNLSKNTPVVELNNVVALNKDITKIQENDVTEQRVVKEEYTARVNINDNPEALIGILEIHVITTDNVGNKSEIVFPTLSGIAIESSAHTLLPDHSNTFKAGQRGYIDITLNGYIEYLSIAFDEELENVRIDEDKYNGITVFSNPDECREIRENYDNVNSDLSTNIDLNKVEGGIQASSNYRYYFDVPIYAKSKDGYKIILSGININGDIVETEVQINVTNSIFDDFRTTIRNN